MPDYLQRAISDSGRFFVFACDTTRLVAAACRRHDVGPTAAVALGRALTGNVLLAALLKDEQSVRLRIEGNGPLGRIITEAGHGGWARGYVAAPQAAVPLRQGSVDVAAGIGRTGFLTVTRDIGMNRTYEGTVQLYTSEIAEDIALYLSESEQVPSAVGLGVVLAPDGGIAAAGGYLAQSLPPADEKPIAGIEKRMNGIAFMPELLRQGIAPEALVALLFADIPYHLTARTPLVYACSCSRHRMERAVLSLGREELSHLLVTDEETVVQCEFCRDSYRFSRQDLERMLATGSQLH
ncbi:Hsp33 family molecular chaperone HslO [Desulfoprunum benzoelyticum]|uniref:33 kDa chaperonin n=1 Tax=Desulfoprunum benzoelyticum TaxID=1506996 RepID=A0A840UTP0_9BACT|nr:Hsp33 family molecular chaperone HslO [Desulfoprunum benzoelyticum]MBB5348123.1 molecular chaperone Hsp33 [Desulfoprunum benzoelyticum]MBM9530266.1 Hsp33 family molecular chaperone HslO [Desulfoprunum benzoelyticum]